MMTDLTSIIICSYNRASLLQRALEAISRQTLPSGLFEIIIVDDGSTDNTPEVCKAMGRLLPNLQYIAAPGNMGLGSAANLGVQSAKGDILIFTDDDCIPREDWAATMRAALAEYPLVAGCVASPTANYIKLCHNIAQFHPFMQGRKAGPIDFIAGANMGVRRSLFRGLKGFPAGRLYSPDMQFILKARAAGYAIYFEPAAVVTHDPDRTSLAGIFKYAAEHASETILLRNRYRALLRTPFIFRSPSLLLAAAPLIALKVAADIYLGNTAKARFIGTAPVVYALKLAWCWGAANGLRQQDQKEDTA